MVLKNSCFVKESACYTVRDMDVVHLPTIFENVIARACQALLELSHVDVSKIFVLVHRLPPTRLGQTIGLRQQQRTLAVEGHDVLYAVSFNTRLLIPAAAREHDALDTVMHELWHVAEACDGTIRPMRHGKTFDAIVRTMRRKYLRAGGEPLPVLDHETRVCMRQFARRARESILFEPYERVTTLSRLVPPTFIYTCPADHITIRHRRLSRPSSCAQCSPRFDMRFLLKENV